MKPLSRILKPLLIIAVPLSLGIAGCMMTRPAPSPFMGTLPASPTLEANKPTVAIVLGQANTEITDVIAPYVAFKTAAAFNVVLVSEERKPVTLSGDLEVIPHLSFAQLDAQLGRDPDVIVVPNIPNIKANEALRLWVQRHGRGSSTVMSVCAGAAMFAATDLLNGQTATTHWGDILWIEPTYPKVRWLRGQRYVENGQFVSTAGILSGIDGSLHLIARMRGKALAEQVAKRLNYPTQYLEKPEMPQYDFGFQDAMFVLNFMSPFARPTLGVALFDGMDEMTLAAIYDVYAPWLARQLEGIAPAGVITTKLGIDLIAKHRPEHWDARNKVLSTTVESVPSRANEFAFDTALKHLAKTADVATAEYTAKRLEYRWFMP
jgi:putative intracellular protease/amidase